jgi:hypothetical protein
MFCPQCKAEYRFGVALCADCQVPLVATLRDASGPGANSDPGASLVQLWMGEDLALHASLLAKLEAAGIRYFDQSLGNYPGGNYPGMGRSSPFPVGPQPMFGYEVAVLSSQQALAKEILEQLLGQEPEDMELPATELAGDRLTTEQGAREDEEPTIKVWLGKDSNIAGFLETALREVEIQTRVEDAGEERRLYVKPSDEARAREIVREIIEGTPQQ